MLRSILVWVCVLLPCLALAQNNPEEVHHHNLTFGVGPAIPLGTAKNYLSTAPLIRFAYGYRFNRLFQGDFGVQMAFGAAHNQNAEVTDFGQVQGGDHEFMIPLGGRIYIPLPLHRIELSAGGGGAYLHYSETAPSGGFGSDYGYSSACYSCTSRGGWGGYGMAGAAYFLDSNRNIRLGVTAQYIAGSTNGQPVANFPATKTTDRWLNLAFDFGFSF